MSRPKTLFELPPELLGCILEHVHSDSRKARKAWAIKTATVSKAFYDWVIYIVWDYLEMNVITWRRWSSYQKYGKRDSADLWRYLSKKFSIKLAPRLKVLVIHGSELTNENYPHFLKLMAGSANLIALGLDHRNLTDSNSTTPYSQRHSVELPWQFDPRCVTLPPAMTCGSKNVTASYTKLERIVLMMDSDADITYNHYTSMFVDPMTDQTVCPALKSFCLIISRRDNSSSLNGKFVDAMVTFCSKHKSLCQLEFYFQEVIDLPSAGQDTSNLSMLRDLVTRAEVSVKLHQPTCCEEERCTCPDISTSEKIGDKILRVADASLIPGPEELWHYKIGKILDWTQGDHVRRQELLEEFDDHDSLSDYGLVIDEDTYHGQYDDDSDDPYFELEAFGGGPYEYNYFPHEAWRTNLYFPYGTDSDY